MVILDANANKVRLTDLVSLTKKDQKAFESKNIFAGAIFVFDFRTSRKLPCYVLDLVAKAR